MLLCSGTLGGAGWLLAVSVGRVSPWRAAHGGVPLVIPSEIIPAQRWQNLLHNQRALRIQAALLFKPGVIVTAVPYHLAR
ncbi:MAG: hypothetical protein AABY63_01740 [candidate division NC10 bacterium]